MNNPGLFAAVQFVPALKPSPPPREVSGTDVDPVACYPGLARTYWQQEGKPVAIEYAGEADYAAVLDHYAKGFAAQGYAQSVQSATPSAEGRERMTLTITQQPKGGVRTCIETTLN